MDSDVVNKLSHYGSRRRVSQKWGPWVLARPQVFKRKLGDPLETGEPVPTDAELASAMPASGVRSTIALKLALSRALKLFQPGISARGRVREAPESADAHQW